ncbi:MAG: glucose 1-dehydrogenase [Candidatus Tectomicrobia bacterium]|nr:glucose 1-dehydrogenase [Candidatus Tectomicrobia bacterium]
MGLEMFSLQGKIAVVTGGGRGLGRAIAEGFAEAGADVVLVARTQAQLDAAARHIEGLGRRAHPVAADVTKRRDVEHVVAEAVQRFGQIDILANVAGMNIEGPSAEQTEEDWDAVLAVNLKGCYLGCQTVGRHMIERGGGRIINMSSIGGLIGIARNSAYTAAKAGIIMLSRSLAVEWARYRINVNALCPGYFITDINRDYFASESGQAFIKRFIPLRRTGQIEEIKGAAIFLASPASNFMTGSALVIDGGQTAW